MKIALASPPFPNSIADALDWTSRLTAEAASQHASVICFPESFIPGYPFPECQLEKGTPASLQAALDDACAIAARYRIGIILPMDWYNSDGFFNIAFVVSKEGKILGAQTKNQLDPSEDNHWTPGFQRRIFEVDGVKFGIVICHEGFRYPETVRWAARQGARIVFHPHASGSNVSGPVLTEWGHKDNPYYEKAIMMRALENAIYFASTNYSTRFPESASALVAPDGAVVAHAKYGQPGVLVAEMDPAQATGIFALRFKPLPFTDEV